MVVECFLEEMYHAFQKVSSRLARVSAEGEYVIVGYPYLLTPLNLLSNHGELKCGMGSLRNIKENPAWGVRLG